MTTSIDSLVELLLKALVEPLQRKELVAQFQAIVWNGLDARVSENIGDVLRELAYDLDLFEPTAKVRAEDLAYYGHRRFEEEIRQALLHLQQLGVDVREDLWR